MNELKLDCMVTQEICLREFPSLNFLTEIEFISLKKNNILIILLTAGNKQRQSNDIKKAEKYYNDFLERDKND